jgi:predicted RNase H-like HicB family nuclease
LWHKGSKAAIYRRPTAASILKGDRDYGGKLMIRQYIDAAMRQAKYEILAEDSTYYGEIPGLEGVYANAASLEACRDELEEVLEEWVLFRISRSLAVPVIDGRTLEVRKVS